MQHCFLLFQKSLQFLGSAMGIAIANRKNRCDFGALRLGVTTKFPSHAPTLTIGRHHRKNAENYWKNVFSEYFCGNFSPIVGGGNQPKFSCIKFFQTRGRPDSLSKTTEKEHLHEVFVRDIPTSGSLMSQEHPAAQKLYVWAAFPFLIYAGSGLFWENNWFPRKVGLRWVFVNGLKWVQKLVFGRKSGSKVGQNPTFDQL